MSVPSLNELVHRHTDLTEADLDWLHALIADWHLLADLSFADLVLWVADRDDEGFVAVAQVRPTTGPTAYVEDVVGSHIPMGRRPLIETAYSTGKIRRDGDPEWWDDVPVRVEAIPVRHNDRVIGVIGRHTNLVAVRTPSRLEMGYLECAGALSRLMTEGRFPHSRLTDMGRRGAPRVGDGLIRLDAEGVVQFASPNAVSVYRRLGLANDLLGQKLGDVTSELAPTSDAVDEPLGETIGGRQHVRTEVAGKGSVVVSMRVIPLDPSGEHSGALVLCRDVTEVRRRERELMSKDATIREIHHRVKNNLQTVAALLRMQARRIGDDAGHAALMEAVRRVGSIAIVHETLSQTVQDTVEFDEVADRLLAMVTEVSATEAHVQAKRTGSFGVLGAAQATPLAMALTEVLQNAVEHGLASKAGGMAGTTRGMAGTTRDGGGGTAGMVELAVDRRAGRLRVTVDDDGRGLPDGFDPDVSGNLGLQIVRTLVVGELDGSFDMSERPPNGTRVVIDLPARVS